jgi:quercetin dioxygenase-like cupin family protein
MTDFPEFMKRAENQVPSAQQNTQDVEGYFFTGADGSQMAFWTCHENRASAKNKHSFDEYLVCVDGSLTVHMNAVSHKLEKGDELHIPTGTEHYEECAAGTRTIHCFGGTRITLPK